jgi:hypothetical protein
MCCGSMCTATAIAERILTRAKHGNNTQNG